MKYFLFFILLLFSFLHVLAQNVAVFGKAQSYAADTLFLQTKADALSTKTKILAKSAVDSAGNFSFQVNVQSITPAFINLDVFEGYIYLEPEQKYEIILPKKTTRLLEDKLNPFFEPMTFYFQILNEKPEELNSTIRDFEKKYSSLVEKYFSITKTRYKKSRSDTVISTLEQEFTGKNHPFFQEYKKYKYLQLENLTYLRNNRKILEQYFINQPLQLNNPAYLSLLEQISPNILLASVTANPDSEIPKYLIGQKSFHKLKHNLIQTDSLPDGDVLDLLIIKSLYNSYNHLIFPETSIFAVLDSMIIQLKNPELQQTALNIKAEISSLLTNNPAPELRAQTMQDSVKNLIEKRGRFVYLVFCSVESYPCQREMPLLNQLKAKYGEVLDVVSVLIDEKRDIEKFVKQQAMTCDIWYKPTDKSIENYQIKVYPTYFLIDPEGKLIQNPAVSPENPEFEARFVEQYKAWKRENERKKQGAGSNGMGGF